ncbi:MAG TPA: hydroxyisourate hydrolase [Polyangiaceae bacterium]|nr:hydroxyisourate hydrolase [Polyangiaceae bacterium]
MSDRSPITTHVLDTAAGRPASGVPVTLARADYGDGFTRIGAGVTDADGRVTDLLPSDHELTAGVYRISFSVKDYQAGFYPSVSIDFNVVATDEHYHVPLLLSPFGYSTYRGS